MGMGGLPMKPRLKGEQRIIEILEDIWYILYDIKNGEEE
jgi:hypothetical protein